MLFFPIRNVGILECDLCPGEGRAVQYGDSVEVSILQGSKL